MHIRSIRRAVCCAALALAAACESSTEPTQVGELRGMWAGEPWDGDAHAFIANDSLYLSGASDGWISGRHVSLAVGAFHGPGTYPLGGGAAEVRYLTGGDGIWASYASTQPSAGMLVVTGLTGGHVTGYVEFVAEAQPGYAPAGDRARFDAEFRARTQLPRLPSR